jgi:hypothetical protein
MVPSSRAPTMADTIIIHTDENGEVLFVTVNGRLE